MAGAFSKVDFRPIQGRKDWIFPLLGTATGIAFAAALTTTLRILRGFAKAREAAFDPPQAILVLGGDKEREHLAAKFAASCGEKSFARLVKPESHAAALKLLPVFVSSGYDDVASVMLHAGVHPSRLRIDNRALDTVTNFTTMVETFQKAQYSHVYVVTSDYHITRAKLIATLVLCSHGIAFTSIVLPSRRERTAGASRQVPMIESGSNKDTASRKTARAGRRLDASSSTTSSEQPISDQASSLTATGSAKLKTADSGSSGTPLASLSPRPMFPRPSSLSKEAVFGLGTPPLSEGHSEDTEFEEDIEPEGWVRRERDRARAFMWMMTGWHGAELLRFTRPTRYRLHKQKPLNPEVSTKED